MDWPKWKKEVQPPRQTHRGPQSLGLTLYPNTKKQLNLSEPKPQKLDFHIHQINIKQNAMPQPASRLTDCVSGQVEWKERARA